MDKYYVSTIRHVSTIRVGGKNNMTIGFSRQGFINGEYNSYIRMYKATPASAKRIIALAKSHPQVFRIMD